MEPKFWHQKWDVLDIKFHSPSPNPNLVTHYSQLRPGAVFVPLCGKSVDLKWLADQGRTVVGAELSAKAIESFFEESKIPYQTSSVEGFTVYRGQNLTIWCGDFFALPPSALTGVSAVYDRAALVALPPGMRLRYTKKISELFASSQGLDYLLVTFEYEQSKGDGPPFSVPEAEVNALFGKSFEVTLLDRHPDGDLSLNPRFKDAGPIHECVHLLSRP